MEREKMMIELELKENIQRHKIEQQETRQMLLQAEEKISGLQKKSERLREMQLSEYIVNSIGVDVDLTVHKIQVVC
jgi:hypothetical protein